MFKYCQLLLAVTVLLWSDTTNGESLNSFISHYEALNYNADSLMKDHTRLTRSIDGPRHMQLQFNALGRSFNLKLYPGSPSLSSDAVVMVDDKPVSHYQSLIYHGVDKDDQSVRVHGDVARGIFAGEIRTSQETYYIEPSARHDRSLEGHSIIYRSSDVIMPEAGVCDHDIQAIHNNLQINMMGGEQRRVSRQAPEPFDSSRTRCNLKIITDDKYYEMITAGLNDEDLKIAVVVSFISNYVDRVKEIYQTTDFDGIFGITFSISTLLIYTEEQPGFEQDNIGVETFLERHSLTNYDDFCLSYRFTARDFADGVLGLAYIGTVSRGSVGGVCERFTRVNGVMKSLNTGIVTIVNYRREVPQLVVQLTLAHQIGHNFGSQDDSGNCGPVDGDGNYIMFPHATTGTEPNNDEFSDCSRDMMAAIIRAKGGCFTENEGGICGNGIVESDEQCDCGRDSNGQRVTDNPCCNCTNCMLPINVLCSPSQGPCCNDQCQYLTASTVCHPQSECSDESRCSGNSALCPAANFRNVACRNNTLFCVDGSCSGSYCLALMLVPCECTTSSERCRVCCMYHEVCTPTSQLHSVNSSAPLPEGGLSTPPGGVCMDNQGYCDFLGNCHPTASEGALSSGGVARPGHTRASAYFVLASVICFLKLM